MIMDINQPFVTQEQKFKYWEESKAEIQTLRAKVASAEVLVETLQTIRHNAYMDGSNNKTVSYIFNVADKAIATYDKLSEVKHDTK